MRTLLFVFFASSACQSLPPVGADCAVTYETDHDVDGVPDIQGDAVFDERARTVEWRWAYLADGAVYEWGEELSTYEGDCLVEQVWTSGSELVRVTTTTSTTCDDRGNRVAVVTHSEDVDIDPYGGETVMWTWDSSVTFTNEVDDQGRLVGQGWDADGDGVEDGHARHAYDGDSLVGSYYDTDGDGEEEGRDLWSWLPGERVETHTYEADIFDTSPVEERSARDFYGTTYSYAAEEEVMRSSDWQLDGVADSLVWTAWESGLPVAEWYGWLPDWAVRGVTTYDWTCP